MVHGAERLGVEGVVAVPANAMFADKPSAAKKTEMLGDGRAGDGKGTGDLSGGLMAVAEEVQDSTAGRVSESAEDGVGGMCNGAVSHNA